MTATRLSFVVIWALFMSVGWTAPVENLEVKIDNKTGGFQLLLSGTQWFESADVWFRNNGKWYSTQDGSITLSSATHGTGRLDWGPMDIYTFVWKSSDNIQFTTYTVVFQTVPAVIFGQQWDDGGNSTSTGNDDDIISRWPAFKIEDIGTDRGYTTWAGGQVSNTPTGKFSPDLKEIYKEQDGGLPLVIFDSTLDNAVVISPQNTFMSAHQQVWTPDGYQVPVFATGILGKVDNIPKGYSMETLLVAGQNITGTMDKWGRLLRMRYKKDDKYRRDDFSINYLGYYTDNGACYYYYTGDYKNYEEAMLAVKEDAVKNSLPYRYLQIDSWWYFKGDHDGVKNWTAMPSIFPNGIDAVSKATGWPIVAHNRFFSTDTVYAKQNGGKYDFIIDEGKIALPNDIQFWKDLLTNARDQWNLWTYEQDWLSTEYRGLQELEMDLNLGQTWLGQMGETAKELGLTIQYCMAYTRYIMQSVMIPTVTQARASGDYHPDNSQWMIGDSSILYHSMGVAPYKDTFHTTGTQAKCRFTNEETAPELETYVAVLSHGPVGPSDTVGGANKQLIMATSMSDGLLLKPSKPMMSLDSTFVMRALGKSGPDGYATATFSQISQYTWYYVLAANLKSTYQLNVTELPPSENVKPQSNFPQSVGVRYTLDGKVTGSVEVTNQLSISSCDKKDFQYWMIAPVLPGAGGSLLGELDKVVPISEQRVLTVILFGDTYVIKLRGAPNEVISMTTYSTADSKTTSISCTLDSTGAGTLAFSDVTKPSC
jgi:hypothetical protein